jgi:signal recognition particle GTPase
MGTSSMHNGRNRSPLLPPDFDDMGNDIPNNPNSQEDKPEPKPDEKKPSQNGLPINNQQYSSWKLAKTSMSRYTSGNAGQNGIKNVISKYVKGYGDAKGAAKYAQSAIRTTIKIGKIFNGISRNGIARVLNEHKILTDGRKPKEILNDIINLLAPTSGVNDDSVARKALINTMSIIYEKFDDERKDISLLDSLDNDIAEILIIKYIEIFIYERLIHDVGSRIEKNAANSSTAASIEKDLKDYIESKVSTTLRGKSLSVINSETEDVYIVVEGLYRQCYNVLEDQL